jgi:hypothetical protein
MSSLSIILSPQQDEHTRCVNINLMTELENFRVREIVGGEVFYIPKVSLECAGAGAFWQLLIK